MPPHSANDAFPLEIQKVFHAIVLAISHVFAEPAVNRGAVDSIHCVERQWLTSAL